MKVAPLIKALEASPLFEVLTTVSGQHRAMLEQVNSVFGITPQFDLDVFAHGQSLAEMTAKLLCGVQELLRAERPDAVVVQGDATTVFAAALGAFYEHIPVVHLEAGLRTRDTSSPFPEEANRQLVSRIAALHLAPTAGARQNLLAEGIDPETIVLSGNTVIDALLWARAQACPADETLAELAEHDGPVLLVTAHRRESWGEPMRSLGRALRRLAFAHEELKIVFPIHANPTVRGTIVPFLHDLPNVILAEPLPYGPFVHLMDRADIILTDSGGIQEEGPSLGTPVLVTRQSTERPEALTGPAALVGTDEHAIIAAVQRLLVDADLYARMSRAANPYGDGRAAARAHDAIAHYFRLGPPAVEADGLIWPHFDGLNLPHRRPTETRRFARAEARPGSGQHVAFQDEAVIEYEKEITTS